MPCPLRQIVPFPSLSIAPTTTTTGNTNNLQKADAIISSKAVPLKKPTTISTPSSSDLEKVASESQSENVPESQLQVSKCPVIHVRRRRRVVEKALRWGITWMVKKVVFTVLKRSIGGVIRGKRNNDGIGNGKEFDIVDDEGEWSKVKVDGFQAATVAL